MGSINRVDRIGVLTRAQAANEIGALAAVGGTIGRQVQAVGVGRIEKKFLWCQGKKDVWITDVEGNITTVRTFGT